MPIIKFSRPLVLATASEARRRLVAGAGLEFYPDAVDIDETPLRSEDAGDYVLRLARRKAEAVVPPSLEAVIVAVDTAIGLDGAIIGKPRDEAHAREILTGLSGRAHEVVSAITVKDMKAGSVKSEVTRTVVVFDELPPQTIDWYISTGEWKGRAGAYAIQDKGAALVKEVRGCFTNVIGISITTLLKMLRSVNS